MNKNEFNTDIPASEWLAVGLLDGSWTGGKVMVAVSITSPLSTIHLVHLLAEQIAKKNGYAIIDTCFAYCPGLDLFLPFTSSLASADLVQEIYAKNRESIAQQAMRLIKENH